MVRLADFEIGCMVQNHYLEAASLGLGACVFGYLPHRKISKLLGLQLNQKLRIAQAVGPLEL
ncbi:MAG: nitroreductase family protein [Candidatus Kariarchaeaceae archaeon]